MIIKLIKLNLVESGHIVEYHKPFSGTENGFFFDKES